MPKITIDNREVEVEAGATILDAAQKLGIAIPTMCYLRGHEATTSCMVCVVKLAGASGLVPACGTVVGTACGWRASSEEVREARKAALELLLSDHVGDCVGPCQMGCPAHMNIPQMIRQIAAGDLEAAIATVKQDIALPAVLGRICPAPCEKACRRRQHDEAVSICLLKRYVADVDLQSPISLICRSATPNRGKRVAIIGAGPAGLAAAYYLQQDGFECTVFDDHEEPGGMLRYGVPESESAPRRAGGGDRTDSEAWRDVQAGYARGGRHLDGRDPQAIRRGLSRHRRIESRATRMLSASRRRPTGSRSIVRPTRRTCPGVFAGGDAVRKRRLAVRAVADGKEAAESIRQYLGGARRSWRSPSDQARPQRTFNSRMGKLDDGEMEIFLQSASHRVTTQTLRAARAGSRAKRLVPSPFAACTAIAASPTRVCCGSTPKPTMPGSRDTRPSGGDSSSRRSIRTSSTSRASASTAASASRSPRRPARSWAWRSSAGASMSAWRCRSTSPWPRASRSRRPQCVQACPTGALAFKDGARAGRALAMLILSSSCRWIRSAMRVLISTPRSFTPLTLRSG